MHNINIGNFHLNVLGANRTQYAQCVVVFSFHRPLQISSVSSVHHVVFCLLFNVNFPVPQLKNFISSNSSFFLLPWPHLVWDLPISPSLLHLPKIILSSEPGHLSTNCSTVILLTSMALVPCLQLFLSIILFSENLRCLTAYRIKSKFLCITRKVL